MEMCDTLRAVASQNKQSISPFSATHRAENVNFFEFVNIESELNERLTTHSMNEFDYGNFRGSHSPVLPVEFTLVQVKRENRNIRDFRLMTTGFKQ